MKISKRRIQQLIKEELQSAISKRQSLREAIWEDEEDIRVFPSQPGSRIPFEPHGNNPFADAGLEPMTPEEESMVDPELELEENDAGGPFDSWSEDQAKKTWSSMGGNFDAVEQKAEDFAEDPHGYAASLQKKATGKWPTEEGTVREGLWDTLFGGGKGGQAGNEYAELADEFAPMSQFVDDPNQLARLQNLNIPMPILRMALEKDPMSTVQVLRSQRTAPNMVRGAIKMIAAGMSDMALSQIR